METQTEKAEVEIKQLKACINDLTSVLALPALWSGGEPRQIVTVLLDVLLGMLRLDFVYSIVKDPGGGTLIEMIRAAQSGETTASLQEISRTLRPWLEDKPHPLPLVLQHFDGNEGLLMAPWRLGLQDEMGWLVAASRRAGFPTETERLLLNVAANQAAIGLQEARLLSEQRRVAKALDEKVAQRTREFESEQDRLRLLLEINKALVANHDLPTLFKTLADNLRRVTECDVIGLALPDPACGLRQCLVDQGEGRCFITEGMAIPLDGSASGKAARTRQMVCLDGLQGEQADAEIYGTPEGKKIYELLLKAGTPSGYFIPLIHGGEVIGVMQLTKYAAMPLKAQTTEFLTALASQIAIAVANALEHRAVVASRDQLTHERAYLREEIDRSSMFEEIVGTSPALRTMLSRLAKVAPTDSTVLITGETGTGKELIARAIHKRSARSGKAFVSINCASIPTALIGSELFGHEKGAFTGATQRRMGRFELAQGGTLFLDEIGELPAETQAVLLRVLQEREFERVGGTQRIHADVRLIAATNRNLKAEIMKGKFRGDLFYRLNVFPIEMPPLRARQEDIPLLTSYFVRRYADKLGRKMSGISQKTLKLFQEYSWPGNIRELQNIIERSLIVCETATFSVDESWLIRDPSELAAPVQPLAKGPASDEKTIIEAVLADTRGRVSGPSGAAIRLSIPASTLESKIRVLKINKHQFRVV